MQEREITTSFSKNLKKQRRKHGLTQKALGDRLGYSAKAISKWESGALPPASLLPKLAAILQISIDSLFQSDALPTYYLGIDGGGTKTQFVLADGNGDVIRETVLGASNPNDVGIDNCLKLLGEGIEKICGNIATENISVFAGLAGCGLEQNRRAVEKFLSAYHFAVTNCGSDTQNAVAAALGAQDGIVVIAGTGSVTLCQCNGQLYKSGGYNYLFEEGGSGFCFGRDAITFALKAEERNHTDNALYRLVQKKCCKASVLDSLADFYVGGKALVASFAPLVFDAYRAGDRVAEQILSRNAATIAEQIEQSAERLDAASIPTVLVGGLANQSDLIEFVAAHLKDNSRFALSAYTGSQCKGALYLAGLKESKLC